MCMDLKLLPLNSHSSTFCVDKKIQEWPGDETRAFCGITITSGKMVIKIIDVRIEYLTPTLI